MIKERDAWLCIQGAVVIVMTVNVNVPLYMFKLNLKTYLLMELKYRGDRVELGQGRSGTPPNLFMWVSTSVNL